MAHSCMPLLWDAERSPGQQLAFGAALAAAVIYRSSSAAAQAVKGHHIPTQLPFPLQIHLPPHCSSTSLCWSLWRGCREAVVPAIQGRDGSWWQEIPGDFFPSFL